MSWLNCALLTKKLLKMKMLWLTTVTQKAWLIFCSLQNHLRKGRRVYIHIFIHIYLYSHHSLMLLKLLKNIRFLWAILVWFQFFAVRWCIFNIVIPCEPQPLASSFSSPNCDSLSSLREEQICPFFSLDVTWFLVSSQSFLCSLLFS